MKCSKTSFKGKMFVKRLPGENTREEQNKVTPNVTCYPVFLNVKKILAELDLLLTPDVAHKIVFTNVPIIDFKNDRSLNDLLVRAVLSKVDPSRMGGRSDPNVPVRYLNQ